MQFKKNEKFPIELLRVLVWFLLWSFTVFAIPNHSGILFKKFITSRWCWWWFWCFIHSLIIIISITHARVLERVGCLDKAEKRVKMPTNSSAATTQNINKKTLIVCWLRSCCVTKAEFLFDASSIYKIWTFYGSKNVCTILTKNYPPSWNEHCDWLLTCWKCKSIYIEYKNHLKISHIQDQSMVVKSRKAGDF